ncbi:endoplasmic reticulum junction formation protein lunapark-B-like [Paramacrobiotus metropolitanus]|uniref:endoplasmic reticulum junction formation protein lunapark-B-like n=1 Tax=Paramacrobiotus metropolitanus TaxID=2943436 RepID=UPI0024459B5D|nr:endoplasmic reticulum junction formation protein lunapark-B-like [Paramacrobiotus metropolitanus]
MGVLLSKFRKAKTEETAEEKLAKIESQIKSLDEIIQQDRQREKRIWASFLFITGFLYVTVAGILHFFVLERSTIIDYAKLVLIWITPVFLIYFLQRWIPWYFERRILVKKEKLIKFRQDKKKILDHVRDNEPYNKAKAILEKYDPLSVTPRGSTQAVPSHPQVRSGSNVSLTKMPVTPFPPTAAPGPRPPLPQPRPGANNFYPPPYAQNRDLVYGRPPQIKHRTTMDRMLDFLVKDGPENRMALICRNCGAHNGLVMLDEFDYTGFKCFECHMPNPSRKPRPIVSRPSISAEGQRSGSFPLTGSLDNQSESSSSSEEEDETTATRIAEEETPVHQATVKSAATIVQHEDIPRVSVAAVDPSLEESDTGSESDVEEEDSPPDSSPTAAPLPVEAERPAVVA